MQPSGRGTQRRGASLPSPVPPLAGGVACGRILHLSVPQFPLRAVLKIKRIHTHRRLRRCPAHRGRKLLSAGGAGEKVPRGRGRRDQPLGHLLSHIQEPGLHPAVRGLGGSKQGRGLRKPRGCRASSVGEDQARLSPAVSPGKKASPDAEASSTSGRRGWRAADGLEEDGVRRDQFGGRRVTERTPPSGGRKDSWHRAELRAHPRPRPPARQHERARAFRVPEPSTLLHLEARDGSSRRSRALGRLSRTPESSPPARHGGACLWGVTAAGGVAAQHMLGSRQKLPPSRGKSERTLA